MIIMSNNQWKCDQNTPAWAEKGEDCSALARAPKLLRAYTEILPDVLCLQEASTLMVKLLMEKMNAWTCPDGSIANYELISGGDTPILYRRDKLKLIESGFRLFDEEIKGLVGVFNNSETKSYCYAVFEDRENNKRFLTVSTHLWWRKEIDQAGSDQARAVQIAEVIKKAESVMEIYGCSGFVMGDFNAFHTTPCLQRAFSLGWKEAHDLTTVECDETSGRHYCYPDRYEHPTDYGTYEKAIDHIIVKNAEHFNIRRLLRFYPTWFDDTSDHYPVYIDVDIL